MCNEYCQEADKVGEARIGTAATRQTADATNRARTFRFGVAADLLDVGAVRFWIAQAARSHDRQFSGFLVSDCFGRERPDLFDARERATGGSDGQILSRL